MAKKSYKIKQKRKLEDILATLSTAFLSMKIQEFKREGKEWVVGLIDNEEDQDIHYIRCENHEAATEIVNELVLNHHCVRGEDIGENPTLVYLSCEDI